jgi:amidase
VGADPGRLRIAFRTEEGGSIPVHPDCVEAVRDAAKLCADLGHEVFEAPSLMLPGAGNEIAENVFSIVWKSAFAATIDGMAFLRGQSPRREDYEIMTWAMYEEGRTFSASQYVLAKQLLERFSREIARFFLDIDVLIAPILAKPPVPLGTIVSTVEEPMKAWEETWQFAPFCAVFNVTGQPAAAIPLYWNDEGLPIGTQFAARFGDEATLFRLAAQLEEARPWANRRPSVAA